MRYLSTRGKAPQLGFEDVLLAGLAGDGGLYLPVAWPRLDDAAIAAMRGRPYRETAFAVMWPYVSADMDEGEFRALVDDTYAGFSHAAVAPLVQLDANQWLVELFHGPTLAFKDFAMQLLARLIDRALARRGRSATIVAATSGDTGAAAAHAFAGLANVDMVILHPHGRVSDVQRRQMTTTGAANVHNFAVDGDFDDCQALVKALFNDTAARSRFALSGVNSINWARIIAQIVYYFTAATALGAPHVPVSFTVPTGNFGDVFAGYAARRMGLAIDRLVIATNANDILARTLATGRYEVSTVTATTSPSMDIQVSSNFERALFEAYDRDGEAIGRLMASLAQSGAFTIAADPLARLRDAFAAHTGSESDVAATIAQTFAASGYVLDPHTAVGVTAARALAGDSPAMVTLATAHPAKFPDAVAAACGLRPALPAHLADIASRAERYEVIANDYAGLVAAIGRVSGSRS